VPTSHTSRRGVHWLEHGPGRDAPAVMLIHGLGGDAKFWTTEQTVLGKDYRVLAVDLRGSGLSRGSANLFSIDQLAGDMADVLDEAGIASAHVIGFSLGGTVAQAMAHAFPQRVSKLVLSATFATVNPQAHLFLVALGALYRRGASPEQMYALIVPWLFSLGFLSSAEAEPYLAYVDDPTDHQATEDWLRLLDALLAYDGRRRLADIRQPTLVIGGDEDRLAPLSDAQLLRRGIHGASLEIIPGGHLMNIESPAAFTAAITRFLSLQRACVT